MLKIKTTQQYSTLPHTKMNSLDCLTSSDEENYDEFQVEFWNNWKMPFEGESASHCNKINTKNHLVNNLVCFSTENRNTCSVIGRDPKFGNWIPPVHFSKVKNLAGKKPKLQEVRKKSLKNVSSTTNEDVIINKCKNVHIVSVSIQQNLDSNENDCHWKMSLNLDWGSRKQLHDVSNCKDGDVIWGVVNLALFARIKLWVNEYENICGLAEGSISKLGSSEASLISISDTQLLRKMLNLSSAQWLSLCDNVKQTKATLTFNALQKYELRDKTFLEKLWIFICKRRCFLQDQCMLVKLSGAVKCLREFKITPKLVVQDIRDFKGQPIL